MAKEKEYKFTDKKDFNNPTEQGNEIEELFDYIVRTEGLPFDPKADIDPSSEHGGSGDRIIVFGNGLKLMIEIKNKDTITKSDINQFKNDYKKDFEQQKVDFALFFSYRTQQITGIDKTIIPYREKSNVMYYGLLDDWTPPQKKLYIVDCIHRIYKEMIQLRENS